MELDPKRGKNGWHSTNFNLKGEEKNRLHQLYVELAVLRQTLSGFLGKDGKYNHTVVPDSSKQSYGQVTEKIGNIREQIIPILLAATVKGP